jgi:hypothetical protein
MAGAGIMLTSPVLLSSQNKKSKTMNNNIKSRRLP